MVSRWVKASAASEGQILQNVTEARADATRITGKIKVGDSVSAQITVTNGQSVAGAIQDPAQVP